MNGPKKKNVPEFLSLLSKRNVTLIGKADFSFSLRPMSRMELVTITCSKHVNSLTLVFIISKKKKKLL